MHIPLETYTAQVKVGELVHQCRREYIVSLKLYVQWAICATPIGLNPTTDEAVTCLECLAASRDQ